MLLANASFPVVAVEVVLGLVTRLIPVQGPIKSILNALAVIVLVLWIGNLYWLVDHLRRFGVGH